MYSIGLKIVFFYMMQQITAKNLQIVHYNNVTLSSCGLSEGIDKPVNNKCFKWHKTVAEQQQQLKNILNGREASIEQFPYSAFIYKKKGLWGINQVKGMCSGAIINEQWIITAAHCLDGYTSDQLRVYTGITQRSSSSDYKSVEKYIIHENYIAYHDPRSRGLYDIALVKLNTKINLNGYNTNSVCLPGLGIEVYRPELAIFTGWGDTSNTDTDFENRRLKMTRIKFNYLIMETQKIDVYEFIDGYICGGDSGGPLVQYSYGRAVLIGIVRSSETKDCVEKAMSFTAIPFYVNWITNTILRDLK